MIIVGHGWLGTKMHTLFPEATWLHHEQAIEYVTKHNQFRSCGWVINCAGFTGVPNVDQCEERKAETIAANTVFPILLAQACWQGWQARLLHFSSGCIYQGGPFGPSEKPNYDDSLYSASKMVSDQALLTQAVICRIRMPFDGTENPKNLLVKLRHYARTSKVVDGLNSLSDIDEMCLIAKKLIDDNAENGPYNLVNQEPIWTNEILSMMGIEANWWDGSAFRNRYKRSFCQLTTDLPTRNVRVALRNAIDKMRLAA